MYESFKIAVNYTVNIIKETHKNSKFLFTISYLLNNIYENSTRIWFNLKGCKKIQTKNFLFNVEIKRQEDFIKIFVEFSGRKSNSNVSFLKVYSNL